MVAGGQTCLGYLREVERVTGDRPDTCPWWGFFERDVQLVMQAHRWFESGLEHHWGDDPPWWAVQGVMHYHEALETARDHFRRTKPKKRGRKHA